MSHAHLTDEAAVVALVNQLAGRKLIGAVEGGGCVELVFDGGGDNLLAFFSRPYDAGEVTLGFVCQEFIDNGYAAPDQP